MTDLTVKRLLLNGLDEAYDQPAWHGANVREAVGGVSHRLASWRPAAGRNTIWEIVLHLAYGKFIIRRRIEGGSERFPRPGRGWWRKPAAVSDADWRRDLSLLDEQHVALRQMVAQLPNRRLGAATGKQPWTRVTLLRGAASHDTHHAGQILLLRKLAGRR